MSKFNKRVLAVAVVGALALPGLAAAATLTYPASTQITFAKDLIVDNGTTITTNSLLHLTGTSAPDLANIAGIAAGNTIQVKVTLTNGAKFDASAPAPTLVANFQEGTQTGGVPGPLTLVGVPYYSASGQELNFAYSATGAGAAAGYFLELNGLQVTNLVQGLGTGSAVGAEITVQNMAAGGAQILASKATIALSEWGVEVTAMLNGNTNKTIDVAACAAPAFARKTRYAPNGAVGDACVAGAPTNAYFNAGGVTLDITKADEVGGGSSYVNNFNANALNPFFNIVGTGEVTVTVTGTNLAAFAGGRTWLDDSPLCTKAGAGFSFNGTINAGNGSATYTVPVTNALFSNLALASPGSETVYVCLGLNGAAGAGELVPQVLSATISVDHNLSTQRVNPPAMDFDLLPLRLNGTTLTFQNVNPAANSTAQSFLRLTNNNADVCPVTIDAKDDAGVHSGSVTYTLAAHASTHFNSDQLENGGKTGATGSFGPRTGGTGKWYVRVSAECSNFVGSALNRNFTDGTVTDLTAEKNNGATWLTP